MLSPNKQNTIMVQFMPFQVGEENILGFLWWKVVVLGLKGYIFALIQLKMIRKIGYLLLLVVLASVGSHWCLGGSQADQFSLWRASYGIEISAEEFTYRQSVFMDNLAKIEDHNSKLGKSYELGLNQFAHLTHEEFVAQYLMPEMPKAEHSQSSFQGQISEDWVDWEAQGAVTRVKNQGSCQSSYAYAAIAAVQGLDFIIYHDFNRQFSNQQIIDCSSQYGNYGCQYGQLENTYKYLQDMGVNNRSTYPQTGGQGMCQAPSGGYFKIRGYATVFDCTSLFNALVARPVSVMVDGTNLQFYRSGIFSNCGTNPNVAMLLVASISNFWRLKNSWGSSWGQGGFIRLSKGNTCGICQQGSYPYA